jgi:hypothetical protein
MASIFRSPEGSRGLIQPFGELETVSTCSIALSTRCRIAPSWRFAEDAQSRKRRVLLGHVLPTPTRPPAP